MKKITKVISGMLVACLMVLELSSVAEVSAAERSDKGYVHQEDMSVDGNWMDEDKNKEIELEKELKQGELPQDDSPIFQHIDKDTFDKEKHSYRLEEEEKLNTYVFGNSDGTKTVYYMHENVKFIDEQGNIKDKDISLVKNDEGYGIVENEVDLLLPENPEEGIDVSYSGYTVSIIPQGGDGQAEATQTEDAVVYEQYFDENASLKYTPLLSGIKEDIILSSYAEDVSYDFIVETDGLYIYNNEKGYYLADEANSKEIFYLGDVEVYDAIGKPCMGEMEISVIEEGQKYQLTLSVDDEFLADPTTVYPVTIDPTITISDTASGTDSIIDAPIFEGYPSKNYAKYKYNSVGTTSASYGVGRTVVKLPGLYNSTEFQTITVNQINSVKFYVKEASGTSSQYIKLHPLATNSTWTETSVTWNNVGSINTGLDYGASLSSGKVTAFDITYLAKAWRAGATNSEKGFILINSDETNNKCFCSSEYSTTSYRPYVVMTYETTLSLSQTKKDIDEGSSFTLTATAKPSSLTVTWSTSDSSIATVTKTGTSTAKVTGVKAGTAVITAKCTDSAGTTYTVSCTVYVCVADGVYYIQNMNSNYYLHVYGGGISSRTNVCQYSKYSSGIADKYKIRQMWKVKYLDNGRYSIRPMNKLNMGLDVTSGNVDIWSIGTTDSLAGVADYAEWTIEKIGTGYVFKQKGASAYTMQVEDASTSVHANVVATTYADNLNCKWTLSKVSSPPSGTLLYNSSTAALLSSSYTKAVAVKQTRTLGSIGITAAVYSGSTINQTVYWTSSDESIATVNKTTGEVTGISVGKVTITAYSASNSSWKASYSLEVLPFADATFFIKNRQSVKYLQVDDNILADYGTSGATLEQWEFEANDYQKWKLVSLDNGYYKIVSLKSGMVVSVASGQTSTQDVALVQETYSGAIRQQWKIILTENGTYKIKPRSSESLSTDLVMAVGESETVSLDGVDVEQRAYVDDSNYADEWSLYQYGKNKYKTLALNEEGINRNAYFEKVSPVFEEYLGDDALETIFTDLPKDELKRMMCDSDIFIIHTHGEKDGIYVSMEEMLLLSDMSGLNLSDLKFALLLTCYNGMGFSESNITNNTPTNIVEKMVCNGAETVVGFTEKTYVSDCNMFAEEFIKHTVVQGESVEEAIESIAYDGYMIKMSEIAVIGGNEDLCLD